MPQKDFIKTEAKVFIDGKEVTNFFTEEVQVITTEECNSGEVLKLYDSFSGTITLSGKQAKRFIKAMVKAERKHRKQKLKVKFQNLFKVVADLFKVWKLTLNKKNH